MPQGLYTWQVTVPPATLPAAPQTTSLPIPSQQITSLVVRVPPGPRGCVGFQVTYARSQAFPYTVGTWVIVDNDAVEFDPPGNLTSGDWGIVAYNTGVFPHTLYVEMSTATVAIDSTVAPGSVPVAIEQTRT